MRRLGEKIKDSFQNRLGLFWERGGRKLKVVTGSPSRPSGIGSDPFMAPNTSNAPQDSNVNSAESDLYTRPESSWERPALEPILPGSGRTSSSALTTMLSDTTAETAFEAAPANVSSGQLADQHSAHATPTIPASASGSIPAEISSAQSADLQSKQTSSTSPAPARPDGVGHIYPPRLIDEFAESYFCSIPVDRHDLYGPARDLLGVTQVNVQVSRARTQRFDIFTKPFEQRVPAGELFSQFLNDENHNAFGADRRIVTLYSGILVRSNGRPSKKVHF